MNILTHLTLPNSDKQNTVQIYLRNYKKIAILIQIYTPILNHNLKSFISKKFHTQQYKLAIFINGLRIDTHQSQIINLKDKSIVHVVHLQRTNLPKLQVYFKLNEEQKSTLMVKTTPQTLIKEIFHKKILPYFCKKEKQIFLAYLGKPINIFKTVQEQYIQNQCQILILEFNKKLQKQIQIIDGPLQKNYESFSSTIILGTPVPISRTLKEIAEMKKKFQKKETSQIKKQEQSNAPTAPIEEKKEIYSTLQEKSEKKQEMVAPSQSDHYSESVAPIENTSFLNKQYSAFKQLEQKPQKAQSNLSTPSQPFKKKSQIPSSQFFP